MLFPWQAHYSLTLVASSRQKTMFFGASVVAELCAHRLKATHLDWTAPGQLPPQEKPQELASTLVDYMAGA